MKKYLRNKPFVDGELGNDVNEQQMRMISQNGVHRVRALLKYTGPRLFHDATHAIPLFPFLHTIGEVDVL